jgi:pimeloyl-ACP methyl ester carboxylesterase
MSIVWIDRMAVDVRGDGDAVVFVHGLGGSLNAWTPVLPALSRHRCVRPELPGAGRSRAAYALGDATAHRGQLSTALHVQALQRVMDALGVARAHVVGHSYGTLIAQELAVQEPQRVRSLALFGALLEPTEAMRAAMRSRAALVREQGLFDVAEAVAQAGLSAHTRETLQLAVAYVRETVGAQDVEGYARNCLALADARAARHEHIRCPVLVVNGDEDNVTPLSAARQLADRLSAAGAPTRLETLGRGGHGPMLERTGDAQRLLRDFLERQR